MRRSIGGALNRVNTVYIYKTHEQFKNTLINAFGNLFIFIIASYGNVDIFQIDLLVFRILQYFKFWKGGCCIPPIPSFPMELILWSFYFNSVCIRNRRKAIMSVYFQNKCICCVIFAKFVRLEEGWMKSPNLLNVPAHILEFYMRTWKSFI